MTVTLLQERDSRRLDTYMKTFYEWLGDQKLDEMQMRTQMKFGYPDGYGVALYPMLYHTPTAADALINMEFRKQQKDFAPPNTALSDPAGDKAQADYRRKMGVLHQNKDYDDCDNCTCLPMKFVH